MNTSSSYHSYSINVPKALPAQHQQVPESTPSKRKGSPIYHRLSSDTTSHSAPNILQAHQTVDNSLGIPDQPISRKRAKSTTTQSPGAVVSKDDGSNAAVSPGSTTPGSCKRKADYKTEIWRKKHLSACLDPICKSRSASSQRTSSSDNARSPYKVQEQQAEDIFITTPGIKLDSGDSSIEFEEEKLKRQAAPPEPPSWDEEPSDKQSCPLVVSNNMGAETFRTAGDSHSGATGSGEADDQEPDNPCETKESDQDESNLNSNMDSTSLGAIRKMHEKLLEMFARNVTPDDKPGLIYVFKDLQRPHLYKIGRSKKITIRLGTIERECGLELELVHYKKVSFYVQTEGLVHKYLDDLCRPWSCELCGRTHGEWFKVTGDLAIAAVDKWVNFIDRENPYDSSSRGLRSCWSDRLSRHDYTFAAVDVDGLRTEWDKFVSPSALDHFSFKFQPVWEKIWNFFWPVYATLAWTATFIAVQHPVVFFFLAISVIGTFVSMSHNLHPLKDASRKYNNRRKR